MGRSIDPKNEKILKVALDTINSLPYRASLRFIFYRLIERGLYGKKGDYISFKSLTIRARKKELYGWEPDTLVDDTRSVVYRGWGYKTDRDLIKAVVEHSGECISHWFDQEQYPEIWVEHRGMQRQFEYYTKGITIRPFGGDYSIEKKYLAAKDLEDATRYFAKPIKILYFGDCDEHGLQIPDSALKDIRKWCSVDFEFDWKGIVPEQVKAFDYIKHNPDKPDEYQWEALEDEDAGSLITSVIENELDMDLIFEAEKRTEEIKEFILRRCDIDPEDK